MKAADRDELLIRIDERVKAIKDGDEGDLPNLVRHVQNMNGRLNTVEDMAIATAGDVTWIKRIGASFGGVISSIIAMFRGGV